MAHNILRGLIGVGALFAAACGGSEDGGVLARVGDRAFTVDAAVQLLAGQPQLPNDPALVEQLAELWVDYTLVALAAREDSLFRNVGLEAIVEPQVRQMLIRGLLERASPVDTLITDDALRAIWDEDPPRGTIRARHILLTYPIDATDVQRDSVRIELEGLRSRIARGESFEALAVQHSQDEGSGAIGGDLGSFGPGDMVRPFEDAAYALEPGGLSGVVESPFGLHLIRVDEKETLPFEDHRDAFRAQVIGQRRQSADSVFLSSILDETPVMVLEGSTELVQELARQPRVHLNRRARERPLVEYEGGELSAGEFWDFLQSRQIAFAKQFLAASDEDIDGFLEGLAETELLAVRAAETGVEITAAERDSVAATVRSQLVQAADAVGLRLVTPEAGETSDQTVDRVTRRVLSEVVAERRQAIPLSAATVSLRAERGGIIIPGGIQAVVNDLAALRAPFTSPPPGLPVSIEPESESASPPDTAGGS